MTEADIDIVVLGDHDRTTFESGSILLDNYFKTQVRQDIKRRVATCFVAVDQENMVLGYYTMAAASILLDSFPETIVKKLPRYPIVPAVLLGRLAIVKNRQGQGLGSILLVNALTRIYKSDIGAFAMIVDAKDEKAASFYAHFGFQTLDGPLRLFLPLNSVRDIIAQ